MTEVLADSMAMMRSSYYKVDSFPETTHSIAEDFATITTGFGQTILERQGRVRIADLTANSLKILSHTANKLSDIAVQTSGLSPQIDIFANDIAYTDTHGKMSPLGTHAATAAQEINMLPYVTMHTPTHLPAASLREAHFGGPIDIGIDRLGVLWFAAKAGKSELSRLLSSLRKIIPVDGMLLSDGHLCLDQPVISSTTRMISHAIRPLSVYDFLESEGFITSWHKQGNVIAMALLRTR